MTTKHLIFLLPLLLLSCSHIDDDERLIYVKPAEAVRSVLIEDFTGQRCVNCPKASEEIQRLQEQYGEDAVIAISIHSGPLGFRTNSRFIGLATDTGDEYFDHWHLDYQPVGLIDRGVPMEYTAWNAKIHEDLQKKAPVSITLETTLLSDTLHVRAIVKGTDGDTKGKLQLWLIEDSITAFQLMPDGTRNDSYLHRHVFRASFNGPWGDDIIVEEGYLHTQDFGMALPDDWNKANLSVVAFVYDSSGVLQATSKKI